jgi:AcrR family transcriptional regulator
MAQAEICPPEELTEEQAAALQAVLASRTMDEAAEAVGISRRSLYRLLEAPELQRALRQARAQQMAQAISRLQEEANQAVTTLGEILRNKQASAASRVRAAEAVLEYALRGSELLDIRAEMEELKAYYADLQQA